MLRTTFLLVFVSRVFCHQSAAKRKSQQRMLSKQDTGVWKVKEEEANNHRRMPKQNAQVCLGHEIKKKCATDIHAIIKCWIQLKDDDDLDRHSMLRKLSLNNKTDSPIDGLFKLSATWSDFKICYSTWLWWLSIAAYTPPPLPLPPQDFVRFP